MFFKSLLIALGFAVAVSQVVSAEEGVTKNNQLDLDVVQLDTIKKLAWEFAPVKTSDALVQNTQMKDSPLNLLSDDAKNRFIKSVTFSENGVTGFRFSDLEEELTPSQIYRVLSLIGVQHITANFDKARVETPTDLLILNGLKTIKHRQQESGEMGSSSCK